MLHLADKGLTRRQTVAMAGSAAVVAATAGGPFVAAARAVVIDPTKSRLDPDQLEVERLWIRLAAQLRGQLHVFREKYEDATRHYLATGDGGPISLLRLSVRSRLGFHLGFNAVTDQCRAIFREAGDFIARLEREFPEVEWDEGTRKRFELLRAWAEAGGQHAWSEQTGQHQAYLWTEKPLHA